MKSLEDFFFCLIKISYVSFCVEPLTSLPLKSHSAFRSTSKVLYGELHVHCTVLFCKTTINYISMVKVWSNCCYKGQPAREHQSPHC